MVEHGRAALGLGELAQGVDQGDVVGAQVGDVLLVLEGPVVRLLEPAAVGPGPDERFLDALLRSSRSPIMAYTWPTSRLKDAV